MVGMDVEKKGQRLTGLCLNPNYGVTALGKRKPVRLHKEKSFRSDHQGAIPAISIEHMDEMSTTLYKY